ncbi:TfoX/Sxy family protein [Streptomyces sp. NPDC001410]|uniref:TfoX/Sxy family protein n=1 Tax=Streptomyces sp. NPDC001410 TaxID=3364574 RepID=UPI0036754C72
MERLGTDPDITEKRMLGGIAFLHRGNRAVGVSGDGLTVRVCPEATEEAPARPGTRIFDMTGRPMRGWVAVAGPAVAEGEVLGE